MIFDESALVSGGALEQYGHAAPEGGWTAEEILGKASEAIWRVVSDQGFTGSKVGAAQIHESLMEQTLHGRTLSDFLWNDRKIVPMLQLERLQDDGEVRKDLNALLSKAQGLGYFGVSLASWIKVLSRTKIKAAIAEQLGIAAAIWSFDMVPTMHLLVPPDSPKKAEIEQMLLDELLAAMGNLKEGERVLVSLIVPTEPNLYVPLLESPGVIRVAIRSPNATRKEACALLSRCFGITSGFGKVVLEGLHLDQDPEEFSKGLEESISQLYKASIAVPTKEIQLAKVTSTEGFFVALDQGGQAAKEALQKYGIPDSELGDDKAVQDFTIKMRERMMANDGLTGSQALAVTLTSEMLSHKIRDRPGHDISRAATFFGREDDAVGNPHRIQI